MKEIDFITLQLESYSIENRTRYLQTLMQVLQHNTVWRLLTQQMGLCNDNLDQLNRAIINASSVQYYAIDLRFTIQQHRSREYWRNLLYNVFSKIGFPQNSFKSIDAQQQVTFSVTNQRRWIRDCTRIEISLIKQPTICSRLITYCIRQLQLDMWIHCSVTKKHQLFLPLLNQYLLSDISQICLEYV